LVSGPERTRLRPGDWRSCADRTSASPISGSVTSPVRRTASPVIGIGLWARRIRHRAAFPQTCSKRLQLPLSTYSVEKLENAPAQFLASLDRNRQFAV
jgi:hypothetical protein